LFLVRKWQSTYICHLISSMLVRRGIPKFNMFNLDKIRCRAQKSCWYLISCGLFYHINVCNWSFKRWNVARKIILIIQKVWSNLEVKGQICLKCCLNWRVYKCGRMLTLKLWSITLKNVCKPKRIRSDLGVKLLKLVKSMVVTPVRLWKWVDIKQTLHTR